MKHFITSDLHFWHQNILKYSPQTRGQWDTVEDMNKGIVEAWNQLVTVEDHTYILGDVAFCGVDKAVELLNQLNGTKTLIIGNHDEKLAQHAKFRNCFVEVAHYKTIKHNDQYIVLMHYPIAQWDRKHYGSLHFHGHMHGKPSGLEGQNHLDVGFDSLGKVVTPLDTAIFLARYGA